MCVRFFCSRISFFFYFAHTLFPLLFTCTFKNTIVLVNFCFLSHLTYSIASPQLMSYIFYFRFKCGAKVDHYNSMHTVRINSALAAAAEAVELLCYEKQ